MKDKLRVMLIDDDSTCLQTQKWVLEEIGVEVVTFEEGGHILQKIDIHQPDLLILDKVMKIDGLEIAEEAIRNRPYLPVLIMSVDNTECDKVKAFTLGCIDYILKGGVGRSEFMQRVLKYCHVGHLNKALDRMAKKQESAMHILQRDFNTLRSGDRFYGQERRDKQRSK